MNTALQQKFYYVAINGQRQGPFPHEQIQQQISQGFLNGATLIWCEGMANWSPLSQVSDFHQTPPPMPAAVTQPNAPAYEQKIAVPNGLAWTIAFAPAIGLFLQGFFSEVFHTHVSNLWWMTIALNVGLTMADERKLKEFKIDTKQFGSAWLIPVYLYKRSEYLQHGKGYFITWCVVFFLNVCGAL